jgi:chromosome segregation ATPase
LEKIHETKLAEYADTIHQMNDERSSLLKTLNKIQEEKNTFTDNHQKQIEQLEQQNRIAQEELRKQIDSLLEMNGQLQNRLAEISNQLEEKEKIYQKQKSQRLEELRRVKQQASLNNEKLKFQQIKCQGEMGDMRKKMSKEIEQLKLNNDQLQQRNGELSRSNGDLRKRQQQLEIDCKSLNEKLSNLKQSNELLTKQRKELKEDIERMNFEHKKEKDLLERLRQEYLSKANAQQTSIDQMIEQIRLFEVEFSELVDRNRLLKEKCNQYMRKCADMKEFIKRELPQAKLAKNTRQKNIASADENESESESSVKPYSSTSSVASGLSNLAYEASNSNQFTRINKLLSQLKLNISPLTHEELESDVADTTGENINNSKFEKINQENLISDVLSEKVDALGENLGLRSNLI